MFFYFLQKYVHILNFEPLATAVTAQLLGKVAFMCYITLIVDIFGTMVFPRKLDWQL